MGKVGFIIDKRVKNGFFLGKHCVGALIYFLRDEVLITCITHCSEGGGRIRNEMVLVAKPLGVSPCHISQAPQFEHQSRRSKLELPDFT